MPRMAAFPAHGVYHLVKQGTLQWHELAFPASVQDLTKACGLWVAAWSPGNEMPRSDILIDKSRHIVTDLILAFPGPCETFGTEEGADCRAVVDAARIDDINILQAALCAMTSAVGSLQGDQPDFILIDGNQMPKVSLEHAGVLKMAQEQFQKGCISWYW